MTFAAAHLVQDTIGVIEKRCQIGDQRIGMGTCIITGAGGFLGQALAAALIDSPNIKDLVLTDVVEPTLPPIGEHSQTKVKAVKADLTSLETCRTLFNSDVNLVYMLHGIMSGAAESDFDLGMKVNVDSSRQILDLLRILNTHCKVIYTSSTAVYGPPSSPKAIVTEADAPNPGSSYGAQKHICETLLNDYSRRGFLDGRVCRLPTVLVRPGKPTGAASSFASGMFREPLHGEVSILPVSKGLALWICSPRTVVKNLLRARDIPAARFAGSRIVNLPGITVTIQEMLDALEEVGGKESLNLISEKRDKAIETIVENWPAKLDTSKARDLGYVGGGPLVQILKEYIEDYRDRKS